MKVLKTIKNIMRKNRVLSICLSVVILFYLFIVIYSFDWNSCPIFFPNETKEQTIVAIKESLDSSIVITANPNIQIILRDEKNDKYTPYKIKKNGKIVYQFSYLKPGAKYKLTTINTEKRMVYSPIKVITTIQID